jgi:hypothetical protein
MRRSASWAVIGFRSLAVVGASVLIASCESGAEKSGPPARTEIASQIGGFVDGSSPNTTPKSTTFPPCNPETSESCPAVPFDPCLQPDAIVGTAESDRLTGSGENDVICGLGGNDTIDGGNGDDTIIGGDGADLLTGGSGDDWIKGNAGNDSLRGGSGDDTLLGEAGDDVLSGDYGDDLLVGHEGTDSANGGEGANRCLSTETQINCLVPPTFRPVGQAPNPLTSANWDLPSSGDRYQLIEGMIGVQFTSSRPLRRLDVAIHYPLGVTPAGFVSGTVVDIRPPADVAEQPGIITYRIPDGVDMSGLSVMNFSSDWGGWEELPSTTNISTRLVSAQVSHFSTFGVARSVLS